MLLRWLFAAGAVGLAGCSDPDPMPPSGDAGLALDAPWVHPDVPHHPDDSGRPRDPRVLVFVTDAIRGEPVPCKLTVRGLDGTATPRWGAGEQRGDWLDRDSGALGIGHWVLLARGRAALVLRPGRYAITASRGGEYEAVTWPDVEVRPGEGAVLRGDLRRVVETEGEVAAEFHVHSAPSFDSDVPLDQRVLSMAVEGIEVFASTDHDALGDFAPAIRALDLGRHIHWIKGDEITADGFGHFNAFPLPDGVDPSTDLTHDETTVTAIIARARAVAPSAVIQLNHPLWSGPPIGYWRVAGFDPATGMSRMNLASVFDAVEVWNGHTLDEGPELIGPDGVIDAWMATLMLGRASTAVGNSDTHRLAHSPPGWPRTYLRVPDDDPARVTDAMVAGAILAGDASLTSGPFLRLTVDGVRPGGLVRDAGGRVTARVSLQAPSWTPVDRVELVANRRVVATLAVEAPAPGEVVRRTWDVPVDLTRDAWVLARTHAAAPVGELAGRHARPLPSLALVNPVYVDVDRNGRWDPPGIRGEP